jgi:glycosidase
MRLNPHLYEINARIFIRRLSQKYGRALTLATVPDEEWQELARLGFDLVWLMGVWQRSPGSRQEALLDTALRQAYDRALPGWTDSDVAGSPYAVHDYKLDPSLGKPAGLAQLKRKLNQQGIALVLDFVPNHLAIDHPWTISHPDWFVRGNKEDVDTHPDWFFCTGQGRYIAHGRDPNFPPWTDTAQLNHFSSDLRQAQLNELRQIAEVADGVRCDMAMLALNGIFERVWGEIIEGYHRPETEFWTEAISCLKKRRPDFLFLGEVYWGFERKLQELGFDFTYDKAFYDRLRFCHAGDIRSYLMMDSLYQQRSVRFIENHDELRAVSAFGRERSLAAAVILTTVPGLRFFHDGQLAGRQIRLPIQLVREPEEAPDNELMQFYHRLLEASKAPAFHEGKWSLLEVIEPARENDTSPKLLAWSWQYNEQFKIVIINYSPRPARGWVKLPPLPGAGGSVQLVDELTVVRDTYRMDERGLYIDFKPWQAQILDISPSLF